MLLFIVKALCLFVPTLLAVYVLGTILLTTLMGVFTGNPHLVLARDLAGVPVLWYAFYTGSRLAFGAAVLVWIMATLFALIGKSKNGILLWLAFMSITGGLVGGLVSVPVIALCASDLNSPAGMRLALAYLCGFGAVGAIICSLLSPLWFIAFHRWLSIGFVDREAG